MELICNISSSLHLWDLSEEPTWRPEVANTGKTTDLEEIDRQGMTQTELDREWNLRNSNVGFETVSMGLSLNQNYKYCKYYDLIKKVFNKLVCILLFIALFGAAWLSSYPLKSFRDF